MKPSYRVALYCAFGVAVVLSVVLSLRAAEKAAPAAAGPRYTVVATDGAHLIVTDNEAGKVYFYAIGPEGKIGDELKLRGSVDLKDVGKPSLKPMTYK